MKPLWFIAILAASATACVEGNNPVQLINAIPQDPDSCERGDIALGSGQLNFDAGQAYVMTFGLFSPITVDERPDASPAAFYAEEVVYNYEVKGPVKIPFTEESRPIYLVVPVGADPDTNWLALNLIGSEARKRLEGSVPTAPDSLTLLATVKLRGKLPSGKKVETNTVTFPIEVTRAARCASGTVPAPATGLPPCANPGQDGFFDAYTCVSGG